MCMLQDHAVQKKTEIGKIDAGLYKLHSQSVSVANSVSFVSIDHWHTRLGHPSKSVLHSIVELGINVNHIASRCDVCQYSKHSRLSFPVRESRVTECFDLVHCDVRGPYRHVTHGKYNSFLTIVDDFSKCTWLYLLSHKSQVPKLLQNFISYVFTQFHRIV